MSIITEKEIINILNNYTFFSIETRNILLKNISNIIEESGSNDIKNIYNIINILGLFNCEQLFINGRITFKQDNYLLFFNLAGNNSDEKEVTLFDGCKIYRGNNSTYIETNLRKRNFNLHKEHLFDFKELVEKAITPPDISIVINNIYYPNLMDKILLILK
jgi:hypothetical protein